MSEETLYPEITLLCASCRNDVTVPEGAQPLDVLWLHERRCRATVDCIACENDIEVPPGHTPAEALWLHEHDCPPRSPPTSPGRSDSQSKQATGNRQRDNRPFLRSSV
jgi:hypothetical protein